MYVVAEMLTSTPLSSSKALEEKKEAAEEEEEEEEAPVLEHQLQLAVEVRAKEASGRT